MDHDICEPPLPLDLPEVTKPLHELRRSPDTAVGGVDRRFDYGVVEVGLAAVMRGAADRVHQMQQAAVVEVGRELIAIKQEVEHGHFVEWVEGECQISRRAAQRAMQAAEMVAKNEKLSCLPASGLTALASRAARPIVDKIIDRIEAGERPSAAAIKAEIKKRRPRHGVYTPR